MDPVTHALIGVNIAGLAGSSPSLLDPLFLGPVIASLAPDLDIILQLKGDLSYLRNHRGFSHSIPGILLLSSIISAALYLWAGTIPFLTLFFWTALGGLSHSLFDLFNSYGVKILWPITGRKLRYSLLGLTDWILIIILIAPMINWAHNPISYPLSLTMVAIYIVCRSWMAGSIRRHLGKQFSFKNPLRQIVTLPSAFRVFKWEFLVETDKFFLVGEIGIFTLAADVRHKLKKAKDNSFIRAALKSKLGKLFLEFTPHFHIFHQEFQQRHVVRFIDLRYCIKNRFMHTGTIAFDENCAALEEFFQPYSRDRKVDLA
ncbi:MAG: metal-dependent hydrolase [Clostridia bacterium]|nr:metal-dependent hydrolase [Clostridia bacterium]